MNPLLRDPSTVFMMWELHDANSGCKNSKVSNACKEQTHLKAHDDARTNKQESHACKGNQAATHDTSSDLFTAGVHELRPS
jgi:hypothetical protein